MTVPVARDREYGTVVWACSPRAIYCPGGHLYKFRDGSMERDHRRLSGHDFFRCTDCRPPSYSFAVFSTTPDAHVTMYLLSESCYREWVNNNDATTLPTLEMLHLLRDPLNRSYNPHYYRP